MTKTEQSKITEVLKAVFESPNESDRNFEPANVVDGLFAIARAIHRLADVIGKEGETDG